MANLAKQVPNLKFLIIGKGPDWGKLEAMIVKGGLGDRVSMVGLMPLEQVAEAMANVDIGVVPKRKDSFGNEAFSTKIMEFMAMGVPAIIARTRIDEYYFNDLLVQFFESGNSEDLAAKIVELTSDPEKRKTLHKNGIEFIQVNNWDIKKEEYICLVDRLVGREQLRASNAEAEGRR
jgi:glycosyltransferase involved in cell wall biosynthesis